MDSLRLFIAVDCDDEGIRKIQAVRERLVRELPHVRWTKPDTWHITIKFLGETNDRILEDIISACKAAVEGHPPFRVVIAGTSGFPNIRMPRVLFAGLNESAPLAALAASIENRLVPLGFEKERRPFHPHITLARIKDPKMFQKHAQTFTPVFSKVGDSLRHEFTVSQVRLYQSTLSPSGPQYAVVRSFDLA